MLSVERPNDVQSPEGDDAPVAPDASSDSAIANPSTTTTFLMLQLPLGRRPAVSRMLRDVTILAKPGPEAGGRAERARAPRRSARASASEARPRPPRSDRCRPRA